jgi:hypothetical protein
LVSIVPFWFRSRVMVMVVAFSIVTDDMSASALGRRLTESNLARSRFTFSSLAAF